MPTSAYRTADGHINVAASGEGMWQRLCRAIGREELLSDERFKSAEKRAANRTELNAALNAVLSTKTSKDWIDVLNAAGVPCGPIYRMNEVFADPQVRHLGAAAEVEHPRLGRFRVLAQAARLSRTPAAVVAPTPEAGQHTDEILAELGYSAGEVAALRKQAVI